MVRKSLLIVFLVISCYFTFRVLERQFSYSHISFPELTEVSQSSPQPDLHRIFSQSFSYLDRGKQSFAFVSEDRQYVLKFFDSSAYIPHFIFSPSLKRLLKKKQRLFNGYHVAYEREKEASGLIYAQLNPTNANGMTINVIDRFGLRHEIDLGKVPFIVQKKATPTREVITQLLQKKNVEDVKVLLRKILDMYLSGYQRGIYDRDHNFMYNSGFVDGYPIRFDVGRLEYQPSFQQPEVFQKDLEKIIFKRIGGWMGRHFPMYRDEIVEDMINYVSGFQVHES